MTEPPPDDGLCAHLECVLLYVAHTLRARGGAAVMTSVVVFTKRGRAVVIPRADVEAAAPVMLASLRQMAGDALDGDGPCWCSEQAHDPWCVTLRAAVKPFWPAWEEWGFGREPV